MYTEHAGHSGRAVWRDGYSPKRPHFVPTRARRSSGAGLANAAEGACSRRSRSGPSRSRFRTSGHLLVEANERARRLRSRSESVKLRRMANTGKRAGRKPTSFVARPSELGALLTDLRTAKGLSLREVEG